MNEEQLLNYISILLLNAGFNKTRDALREEALEHGYKIVPKDDCVVGDIRDYIYENGNITLVDEVSQKLKFADYMLNGGYSNHE